MGRAAIADAGLGAGAATGAGIGRAGARIAGGGALANAGADGRDSMRGDSAGPGVSWSRGASVIAPVAAGDSVVDGSRLLHQPASTSNMATTIAGNNHADSPRGRDIGVGGNSIATSGARPRRRSASDLRRASRINDIGSVQYAQQAGAGQVAGQ